MGVSCSGVCKVVGELTWAVVDMILLSLSELFGLQFFC